MDPSGTKEIEWPDPIIERCFRRHSLDYAALSATPDTFKEFTDAVALMQRIWRTTFLGRGSRSCPG